MNHQELTCADDCQGLAWVFRLLVFAQVVLIALLMFASQSANQQWPIWLVKMLGVSFGLWAIFTMGRYINISPKLKENAPLRTSGPYRFVRHPMYLALMVFCGAFVLSNIALYTFSLWLALLFVIGVKINYEERILRTRFPGYSSYAQKTKRIIPFLY